MMRKIKEELFPKVSNGSPGPIIAEGSWSFSLTSGHGRHVHKNVYRNSVYRNKSWDEWSDGEDKSKQRINQMQQPIKCNVHYLPQETSTVLHGWSSLMPSQPKFYTTDAQQTTQQMQQTTQQTFMVAKAATTQGQRPP
jgi:hypothetical protein